MKHVKALEKLTVSLKLERHVVGVKFLFSPEEYDRYEVKEATGKMAYCVMVKLAGSGYESKSTLIHHGCGGGTRALGLEDAPPEFYSGREYLGFGLYEDLAIAKDVVNHVTLCRHKAYGIAVRPLEKFTEPCDIVIIITNPYNAMRLIQGYTYSYGSRPGYRLNGNQAVCSECTAYPFETNAINISMLCSGTRYLAGWSENDLGLGIPYAKFIGMCEGVYASINGTESNERKGEIVGNIASANITPVHIGMDEAYYIQETRQIQED